VTGGFFGASINTNLREAPKPAKKCWFFPLFGEKAGGVFVARAVGAGGCDWRRVADGFGFAQHVDGLAFEGSGELRTGHCPRRADLSCAVPQAGDARQARLHPGLEGAAAQLAPGAAGAMVEHR
jgi:hypothetical protein